MTAYAYTTRAEVQTAFNTLAKLESRLESKAAKLKTKIAAMQAKHEAETAADMAEISAIRAAVSVYAEQNRAELTGNGKTKTAKIGNGCIKWRKQPAKVEITGDMAAIFTALKRRKLARFIRMKEELDKAAILKEATAIKTPIQGLNIISGGEVLSIETGGES